MNEPEIARRCSTCGASIRKRAQFCPQCGEAVSMRIEPTTDSDEPATEAAESRDTIVEMRPDDPADTESRQTLLLNPDMVQAKSDTDVVPDLSKTLPLDAPFPPTQPLRRDGGVGLTSSRLRDRAQPSPRKPVESTAPITPVQKLKKVSSVVIDEAAYDPSIRFLLVTALLFILFLFLLVMSKILS